MKTKIVFRSARLRTLVLLGTLGPLSALRIGATPDLWIRDDAADVGNEPNTLSAQLWKSDDIWIRRLADPNFDPEPFPCNAPTWTPLPHEGPCYRDPIYSSPNYMYIRVRNKGTTASTGTETLHAYWAKKSTGLSWPTDWNDHLDNPCGGALRLYGYEVTKPRKNGATASPTEIMDYVDAINAIDAAPHTFPGGDTYFDKQNQLHSYVFSFPNNIHGTLQFFPWHREMMGRYEALLRKEKPALTLLYWDWTTDPSPTIAGPTGFMGASSGVVGTPFSTFGLVRAKPAGAPTAPGLAPAFETSTILPSANFGALWGNVESPAHNQAHGYLGGTVLNPGTAAREPLFFMLHANCDRVWARWQRNDPNNVDRWTPGQAYDSNSAATILNAPFKPFDGSGNIRPWGTAPNDGHIISKTPKHNSIIFPPIYDDALLTIPVLQPGECTIIEIPFYPPPEAECGSFAEPSHLCLLARIEPITSSPPEGTVLWQNVKNHNNIAWKNVTLSDCNTGPFFKFAGRVGAAAELIRNPRDVPAEIRLVFTETTAGFRSLFDFGAVRVRMDDDLYNAWVAGGRRGTGIEVVGNNELLVFNVGASIEGIQMDARKVGHMDVALELNPNYQEPFGEVFQLELQQFDDQGGQDPVGGQTFELDFNRLPIVAKGSDWNVRDDGTAPPAGWNGNFDNSGFVLAGAPFGFGRTDVATGLRGSTAYFHQVFEVENPQFFRNLALNYVLDDGIAVYLNGEEVHRDNLPDGPLTPGTRALNPVTGAAARACRSVRIDDARAFLQAGRNILAVELHPAAPGQVKDMSFDLELAGNVPTAPYQPPAIVIEAPRDGAVVLEGSTLQIQADVFDPDGDLNQVRILFDGQIVFNSGTGPFTATVPPPALGVHRVSVLAEDIFGQVTRMESVFSVVSNLNPIVTIDSPLHGIFPSGATVPLQATATDPDGAIVDVSFHVRNHFGPDIPGGGDQAAPFEGAVSGLPPGHYAVYAVATDDEGGLGYSLPGHFVVEGSGLEISNIEFKPDGTVEFTWNSTPGASYFIDSSMTLTSWGPIETSYPSQGGVTTYNYSGPLLSEDVLFFRVGENP